MAVQHQTIATRTTSPPAPELLDVHGVATLLDCSARHIYRMCDAGKLPAPVRIGSIVRWRKAEIYDWIADGCKPVRTPKGVGR